MQFKMIEFKAKVVSNSTAIAQIFNVEIIRFGCRGVGLISTSLGGAVSYASLDKGMSYRAGGCHAR